jgi:hypothetical protein
MPEKSVKDQYRPEMKNGMDFGMGCGPPRYAIVGGDGTDLDATIRRVWPHARM